jgi:hypothetical protein
MTKRPTDALGLLRHYRPTRYEHEDREWMRPAVDAVERQILDAPDTDALVKRLAREQAWHLVRKMEENDVRTAHNFLKEVGRTGQWPLSVAQFETEVWPSPIKIGRVNKVRFEICQTADFTQWELEIRRAHDGATQRVLWMARGAVLVTRWMTEQHIDIASKLDKGAIPFLDDVADVDEDDTDQS